MIYFLYLSIAKISFQQVLNLLKIAKEVFYILYFIKSSKSGVYLTLTEHFSSDQPCFKCSRATCDQATIQTAQFQKFLQCPFPVSSLPQPETITVLISNLHRLILSILDSQSIYSCVYLLLLKTQGLLLGGVTY